LIKKEAKLSRNNRVTLDIVDRCFMQILRRLLRDWQPLTLNSSSRTIYLLLT